MGFSKKIGRARGGFLTALMLALMSYAPLAFAQEGQLDSSNIEVNLDVLNAYKGSSQAAPLDSSAPVVLKPPPSSVVPPSPLPQGNVSLLPPPAQGKIIYINKVHKKPSQDDGSLKTLRPEKKPQRVIIPPPTPAKPAEEKAETKEKPANSGVIHDTVDWSQEIIRESDVPQVAAKDGSSAPLPPHRPRITNAPVSFIERARAEASSNGKTASPPRKHSGNERSYEDDELGRTLAEPTARDVLNRIGDDELSGAKDKKDAPSAVAAPVAGVDNMVSLGYKPGIAELPESFKPQLEKEIHDRQGSAPGMHIEIQSYASKTGEEQSSARRVSLARALELRDFLIGLKIDPKAIDIRALGDNTTLQPADRVEIIFSTQNP